jgi:hypothetical protein
VLYDGLTKNPQGYVDRIVDFVGMPRFQLDDRWLSRVHSSDTMSDSRSPRLTALAADTADWLKQHRLERVGAAITDSKARRPLLGSGEELPPLPRATAGLLACLPGKKTCAKDSRPATPASYLSNGATGPSGDD